MAIAEAPKKELKVIGKRVPKVMGTEMVTGEAVYAADIKLPMMLTGKVLRSPHAHAKIKRIDISKAEKLPGVKAIISGPDFPEVKPGASFPMGEIAADLTGIAKLVIAQEKAIYHGHAVAAVAATDTFIAEEAVKLIDVEYEVLPPVLELLDAMKPGSPIVDPGLQTKNFMREVENPGPTNVAMHAEMSKGNVEQGFEEADVVVEREYHIAIAHQGYIEPMASTAVWEPDGRLTVWTTTQGSFTVQNQLAGLLDIPNNQVTVVPTEIGGGFGGKIYVTLEPLVALLSAKAGRPVQIVMTREDVLRATGPGSAGCIRVKSGCKKDGTITAISLWAAFDAGCIPGSPMMSALTHTTAPYNIANVKLDGYDVITNKTRVAAYRGPGAPQGAFAGEQNIDIMAEAIGMDSLEFRMKNAVDEGDVQVSGARWGRIGLKEILRRIKKSDHWNSKLEGPNRGRGLSIGSWAGVIFTSSANVMINRDGTISSLVGAVDITGTRTTIQQLIAEELDLDPNEVTVKQGSTDMAPYADLTGGSRITYTYSVAINRACADLLAKLKERVAERLKVAPDEIEYSEKVFTVRGQPDRKVTLKESAMGGDGVVVGSGSVSRLQPAPTFAAALSDVEVDPETGKPQILRWTAFQDCGRAVNPTRVEAQMQGGAVQGIGWALTEEYCYDDKGALRNASLLDYRQPTFLDLPMIDCEIIEVPAPDGPYGIRGVGEVPIVAPMASLANAVAHAINGVRVDTIPMTPERTFQAIKEGKKPEIL